MKKILFMVIFLTGCTPIVEKVPVWTPPNVKKPVKPVLISDGNGTDGEVARKLSIDLNSIMGYSLQCENTLDAILSQSQNPKNNK